MSALKVEFIDNSSSQYDDSAARIKLGLGKNCGKLYLGDRDAGSYVQLKFRNCTHVVNCSREMHGFAREPDVTYLKVDPADEENNHLEEVCHFLESELAKRHNIVVQCENGTNKSAAVILFYIMKKKSLSLADAHRMLKELRPIKVAPSLMKIIIDEEQRMRGCTTVSMDGRNVVYLDEVAKCRSSVSKPRGESSSGNPYLPLYIAGGIGGFFAVIFGAIYLVTGKI